MDSRVVSALLADERVAWIVADSRLVVQSAIDPTGLLALPGAPEGALLPDILPEMVGSEPDLESVLRNGSRRFELDLVAREDSLGRPVYLRLLVVSGDAEELLCIAQDATQRGVTRQRLMQSRNELLLAQRELGQTVLSLESANAELRRFNDLKSMFVSVAAHELRTPLAVITGYADLLTTGLEGDLNRAQAESVDIIRQEADRLMTVTANLLDMTRIEAGRLELVLQVSDLAHLTTLVVAGMRELFQQSDQQLQVSIASDLPLALIDELRAKQILVNLLGNAHKYTPPGGQICVSLGRSSDPAELLLTVSDTGVGIAPEDQPAIGTWFFRAKSASQISAQGFGLGLYITRSLVDLHGGRLWFESVPGAGSAFHVTFLTADSA